MSWRAVVMIKVHFLHCSYFCCHLNVLTRLKQFYANSSNLQYFKNLIKVPSLPDVCMIDLLWCFCHTMLCCVYPSVCLSRSYILSKWINISSKIFPPLIANHTIHHSSIPRGALNEGRVGRHKSRFLANSWLSVTAAVHHQQLTVFHAVVYNRYGASLFTTQVITHRWICRREGKTEFICMQQ